MIWILLSFLASLSRAGSRVANQYFQLPGLHLVLWIKIIIAVCLLPVVVFLPWPNAPWFYVFLFLQAPFVVYQDKKTFDLTAQHGGGVVTRIEPLSVVVVFILWLIISPSLFSENLTQPVSFMAILVTICLMAFCTMKMRQCHVGGAVIKQMLPLIVTTSIVSVLGKLSIDQASNDSGVFIYIFVQSVVMFLIALGFSKSDAAINREGLLNKRNIGCAVILSAIMFVTVFARVFAYRYVENPAYVNAIVLTAPFWVVLFYKMVKHEEKGNIFWGLGLVVCAIILTVLVV